MNLEDTLRLTPWHRQRTYIRMDAGFGTDANLNWLLQRGYQLVAKNQSGRRAGAWGSQIDARTTLEPDHRWIALSPQQIPFCRPTRTIAVRWRNRRGELKHALYVVTDMSQPIADIAELYNLRGGFEVDIREDKQGLLLSHRRKRQWSAQVALCLLNDWAHNFLSAFHQHVLFDTPLAAFGLYRLVREVPCIPGRITLDEDGFVAELELLCTHPHPEILALTLPRLWHRPAVSEHD